MTPQPQPLKPELVEPTETKAGKSRRNSRVKPRQLSPILHQVIIDQFKATRSTEDVAEALCIPVRTVTDVVLAAILRMAPQPDRGGGFGAMPLRRTA